MKAKYLIEKIHYYLCYCYHRHLSKVDTEILRKQPNLLYYTSIIYHKLRGCGKPKHVYFISYVLCIKLLLDINLYRTTELAEYFTIGLYGTVLAYESYYLSELDYNFKFLEYKTNKMFKLF